MILGTIKKRKIKEKARGNMKWWKPTTFTDEGWILEMGKIKGKSSAGAGACSEVERSKKNYEGRKDKK
jgi:hypothetical protein